MDAATSHASGALTAAVSCDASCLDVGAPPAPPEPCSPAELRALVHGGLTESDACETLLAHVARIQGALEVEIGDGLAALCIGDRLSSLGFSNLRDYAREVLDVDERTAQGMARLSRELRSRPLLRAAVRAGQVRPRNAQTVLPVAVGTAEAEWVERARVETVRALEKAVRAVRAGVEGDEAWTRFRVRLSAEHRATIDEALAIAGSLMPGSGRPQRLEAIAQEYLAEHALEAGDDGGGAAGNAFRAEGDRLERRKAELELQTERWSFLPRPPDVPAPGAGFPGFDRTRSAREIDRALRDLAAKRDSWDRLLGYCAYAVRRSGLWHVAGFASFEHYCSERLGLSPRAVEQRAAVEKRIWQVPALRAARDAGLSYERVRILSRLPDREIEGWIPRARELTCVALRTQLEQRDEAQMRAVKELRARVPVRIALVLQAAFRAARASEGRLLDDGRCLVLLARHFRRHVEAVRDEGTDPLPEGPRARSRPVPGAGVQPEGGARPSRGVPLARRFGHGREPGRALRLSSPARSSRRVPPRARPCARRARLGSGRLALAARCHATGGPGVTHAAIDRARARPAARPPSASRSRCAS